MIGYVDTDYGNRPAGQITAELGRYLDWYDVSGVCLDRAATSAASLAYYAALSARVRKLGARVVFFNHGAYPDEGYARHADLLGAFEGPWPAYRTLNVPRWTRAWPSREVLPCRVFGTARTVRGGRRAGHETSRGRRLHHRTRRAQPV